MLITSEHPGKHVLLIDPEEAFGQILQNVLGDGYTLKRAASTQGVTDHIDLRGVDVILLNLDSNGESTLEDARILLHASSDHAEAPPVIAYGWDARRRKAVEALQFGAVDFLEQPLDVQALKFALEGAYRRAMLGRDLAAAQKFLTPRPVEGLLGNSEAMEQVNEIIRKVAGVNTSVLITGESGTGKGVAARAIHNLSDRADKPFVAFSACAFPESLIEDELFGHEKGAFTGASQARRGRFEEAKGGTIFLDEIGDLALPLQAKLLRVLQERSLERLGSNAVHSVDVRVICATSRNLERMVQDGSFREDLYFRISVVNIPMPPLRERGEDIPLLAEYFLSTFATAHKKRARGLTPGFLSALARHDWPGNVRELQNVIERSLVLANGTEHLGIKDLPPDLKGLKIPDELPGGTFHVAVRAFKRELVRSALRAHSGNKLKAARELGISRCYLHRMLNQLRIADTVCADDGDQTVEDTADSRVVPKHFTIGARVA